MRKRRRTKTPLFIAIALVISVVGLGVAFAAFSTQLTINGSATVESSSWDIHYSDVSGGTAPSSSGKTISASLSNTQSGITATSTSTTSLLKPASFTWAGTFKTPGDRITYTFYICNKGSYSAKLTTLTKPTPTCTKGGSAETTVCGKVSYNIYTNSGGSTALALNDTIAAGNCKQVWLIATLNADMTTAQLPNADVTVNPIEVILKYTQN